MGDAQGEFSSRGTSRDCLADTLLPKQKSTKKLLATSVQVLTIYMHVETDPAMIKEEPLDESKPFQATDSTEPSPNHDGRPGNASALPSSPLDGVGEPPILGAQEDDLGQAISSGGERDTRDGSTSQRAVFVLDTDSQNDLDPTPRKAIPSTSGRYRAASVSSSDNESEPLGKWVIAIDTPLTGSPTRPINPTHLDTISVGDVHSGITSPAQRVLDDRQDYHSTIVSDARSEPCVTHHGDESRVSAEIDNTNGKADACNAPGGETSTAVRSGQQRKADAMARLVELRLRIEGMGGSAAPRPVSSPGTLPSTPYESSLSALARMNTATYLTRLQEDPANSSASRRLLRIIEDEGVEPASSFGLKLLDLVKALHVGGELGPAPVSAPASVPLAAPVTLSDIDQSTRAAIRPVQDRLDEFADMLNHIAVKVGVVVTDDDERPISGETPVNPAGIKTPRAGSGPLIPPQQPGLDAPSQPQPESTHEAFVGLDASQSEVQGFIHSLPGTVTPRPIKASLDGGKTPLDSVLLAARELSSPTSSKQLSRASSTEDESNGDKPELLGVRLSSEAPSTTGATVDAREAESPAPAYPQTATNTREIRSPEPSPLDFGSIPSALPAAVPPSTSGFGAYARPTTAFTRFLGTPGPRLGPVQYGPQPFPGTYIPPSMMSTYSYPYHHSGPHDTQCIPWCVVCRRWNQSPNPGVRDLSCGSWGSRM